MTSIPQEPSLNPDGKPRFMRMKQLTRELSISETQAWKWVAEGKLPQPKRPSRRVSLFDWAEVEKMLSSS